MSIITYQPPSNTVQIPPISTPTLTYTQSETSQSFTTQANTYAASPMASAPQDPSGLIVVGSIIVLIFFFGYKIGKRHPSVDD